MQPHFQAGHHRRSSLFGRNLAKNKPTVKGAKSITDELDAAETNPMPSQKRKASFGRDSDETDDSIENQENTPKKRSFDRNKFHVKERNVMSKKTEQIKPPLLESNASSELFNMVVNSKTFSYGQEVDTVTNHTTIHDTHLKTYARARFGPTDEN